MKRVRPMFTLFVVMMTLLLSACSQDSSTAEEKMQITTTTGMIADIAKQVGGDQVKVTSLMGPGVDPHVYQASQGDIRKLNEADLILYHGLKLEGKMIDMLTKMGEKRPVVAVTEMMSKEDLLPSADYEGQYDPHVWFDILLWKKAVQRVEQALIELQPEQKAVFEANSKAYQAQLDELDQYVQKRLQEIPEAGRVLITAHDAFGYFGKAYDMEVIGLQGISTDSEYGLKDVQLLVDQIVSQKIKAVFIESSVSERSIQAVVQGAKSKGHVVEIGGELFSDAMGEEGTEEGTFVGMVRHNVDTLVEALK